MHLENTSEFGHIACGSWWVPDFVNSEKPPFRNVETLLVSVDLFLTQTDIDARSLLRMAIASSVSISGEPRFTEIDFWDSNAIGGLLYARTSKYFNGSDEYSYQVRNMPFGQWITFTQDFLPYIKASWGDLSEAFLESIYVVVESDCRTRQNVDIVSLDVRNLTTRVRDRTTQTGRSETNRQWLPVERREGDKTIRLGFYDGCRKGPFDAAGLLNSLLFLRVSTLPDCHGMLPASLDRMLNSQAEAEAAVRIRPPF